MDEQVLLSLIQKVKNGLLDENELVRQIKAMPFRDLGEVKFDTHRALRKGFAEIVYCPGKSESQLESIASALVDAEANILFSRATAGQYEIIHRHLTDAVFHEKARLIGVRRNELPPCPGLTVITAGSSDVPVAEEAAVTAEYMGCTIERLYDVGVAGIHRLLAHVDVLQRSRAIVAVAGMEGALPSVVGGLVSCPVVAVPTSTGYGANLGGIAPLLTMLNSCASGISVMNIDNGLGAGYFAALVVRQSK
ncbi:MAG: nickel pincer cofactor biosynthesis protein LarB [Synergistaceae bacterium]|jgi:NCAIR mutase (PurE)-related protein|nr:nickel pincer cofactor biosynthesis protein LarB [Synergistaceae bacterium]MDD4021234.1 nickel pincer cofactor biosynthesis protein LarB [Synergistaceae bacterium]